ncbi:unnamed protein product [Durusdinium trenchii]|uniref:Protein C10 n=3 Tax=Durusdinium trenchii TaxID=1381693 RepID=A0ABP0SKH5_9DINO
MSTPASARFRLPCDDPTPDAKPRNAPRNDVVVDIEVLRTGDPRGVVVRHAVEEDHPDEVDQTTDEGGDRPSDVHGALTPTFDALRGRPRLRPSSDSPQEARFVVKSNATMKAVREALAAHLGKPELLKTCRLVQRVGENGAFSSFKDSEKLNSRRALLVLGVPSLRLGRGEQTASEEAEDQPSQWAQPRLDEPTQASVQPPEPPKLTLHQALALQRDLLQGFSDSTFQAKRKAWSFGDEPGERQTDPKRFSAERQKLFLSVQKVVLPRYGFEAGPKGVFDMLVQFDQSELVMNPTFQQQAEQPQRPLKLSKLSPQVVHSPEEDGQGKPPESKTRAPPQPVRYEVAVDMEVVVRHAVQEGRLADEEARFTVKSNATMKAVKEALASHLGKPELVKTCRLVQSVGDSAFSSFKDSEKLNNRRALLVMGVPSLRTQAAAPPEKSEKQFQPEERRPAQASRAPRVVQPEAPPLTIPQALALQRDLLQRFSDPEFQSKRKEKGVGFKELALRRVVADEWQSDPRRFSAERQKLFLSVQKLVLPRYGFEGSPKGVFEMMVQFDRPELVMNSTFQHQGATLNYLLFAEDLPEPSQMAQETAQETAPQASRAEKSPCPSGKGRKQKAPQAAKDEVVVDIEVVLRHAVEEDHPLDEEARFTVKSNADMKQVKEALAAHLGKPELVKSCRLVQRLGENSAFTSFKDFEKLNNRRALLVLGVNSLRTASEDAQEEKERSARREEKPQEEKLHPLDREDQASPEAWVTPEAATLVLRDWLPPKAEDLMALFEEGALEATGPRAQPESTASSQGVICCKASQTQSFKPSARQSKPRRFSAERQKLFLSVQKIVLPRYGFEGVFDMLVQFDRPEFASNPTFMEQGATLNYLLFPEDLPGGLNNAKEFLQAQTVERTPPRAEPRPPRAARKPRKAAEPHRLTPAQAVALQEVARDLRQGFADPTWQAKRKELEKTLKHSDPRKFSVERFLSVQKEVLPKHGFEGSPKGADFRTELPAGRATPAGVFEMMQQFDRPDLQINEDFQRLGAILNDLLFSEEPTGTGSRRVEPKEIEVTIRHALDEPHLQDGRSIIADPRSSAPGWSGLGDEEAQLLVSTDATFRQLKEALAEQLEDPQVLQTCRFVRRVGESGAFSSFMESERLQTGLASNSGGDGSCEVSESLGFVLMIHVFMSSHPVGDTGLAPYRPPHLVGTDRASRCERLAGSKRLRKPLSPRLAMAKLTPQQAVALQKDWGDSGQLPSCSTCFWELYEGFSSPLFRERLKKLWQQKPTMESRKYRAERQKLFLTVQSAVLPRYGLEGTERGVFEMLSQFDQPEIHSTEVGYDGKAEISHVEMSCIFW